MGQVATDAAYVNIVLACGEERHGVLLVLRVVKHGEPFGLLKSGAGGFGRDRRFGFHPYGLGMAAQRGYTHTGGAGLHVAVHDFARFIVHLHLLLGVVVVKEDVHLRNHVECQLVRELFYLHLVAVECLARLGEQFVHGYGSGTAGGLIGRHADAADVAQLFDGLQSHDHDDGGAIGVGDDAARAVEGVFGIAFGHNQRHVAVHAESAGVVNHDGPVLGDVVSVFL